MRDRSNEIAAEGNVKSSRRDLSLEATAEVMAAAPKGTIGHRIYQCQRLSGSRGKYAPKDLVNAGIANPGTLDYDRALRQRPPAPRRKKCEEATFQWDVRPEGGWFEGTVYPDGSYRDGRFKELARGGWGFVVISKDGRIVAAASGVPPEWIDDIGGAEAWALYQAARFAVPGGCRYISDSLTTIRSLRRELVRALLAAKSTREFTNIAVRNSTTLPPNISFGCLPIRPEGRRSDAR